MRIVIIIWALWLIWLTDFTDLGYFGKYICKQHGVKILTFCAHYINYISRSVRYYIQSYTVMGKRRLNPWLAHVLEILNHNIYGEVSNMHWILMLVTLFLSLSFISTVRPVNIDLIYSHCGLGEFPNKLSYSIRFLSCNFYLFIYLFIHFCNLPKQNSLLSL